jgi:hypothetical protein
MQRARRRSTLRCLATTTRRPTAVARTLMATMVPLGHSSPRANEDGCGPCVAAGPSASYRAVAYLVALPPVTWAG